MTAVQTSEGVADATYFLPVDAPIVTQIIEKEKPDTILINLGGKTAFACARELANQGVFEKYNVRILGTRLEDAELTNQREAFLARLAEAGISAPRSVTARNREEALNAAREIGYPLTLRSESHGYETAVNACHSDEELERLCAHSFSRSLPVFIEQWLGGWKEIEFEVLRDARDNCVVTCTLENLDPLGIHTGDSFVVVPAKTLTADEMARMRADAFKAARLMSLVGEANIRFAVNPLDGDILLFEASTIVTRSTAIASKATGIQIPRVSTKLALGYLLPELENRLSGGLSATFESAFDYLALKVPRWDFSRFSSVDRHLASGMKSVGEAMAFGKTFEEVLQKAIRMTNPSVAGIACHPYRFKDLKEELRNPTDLRIFAIHSALLDGWTADRIWKYARIDRWFLESMRTIANIELELRATKGAPEKKLLLAAKQAGFSDEQIASCTASRADKIRLLRIELGIRAAVKQIDNTAGAVPTKSNCLYMTYNALVDDVQPSGRGILITGSGPYHIGSSQEYDWCCASALETMKSTGSWSIMVNCNPDAVSTDFTMADRLYFEELSLERIQDIWEAEHPEGVLLSYGGQASTDLALPLSRLRIPVLGTNPAEIVRAEDRYKFSALLDELGIKQPEWKEVLSFADAEEFARTAGYPLLVRPGFSSSESSAAIAWDEASLREALVRDLEISPLRPAILSTYVENSKEIEIDAVANKGEILVYAISEHIENAGVHSGDATVVLPAQRIYLSTAQAVKKTARRIARALEITGPFNIRFLAKSTTIQAIGCSVRASRSFPFCSKVFHLNFVDIALRAQLGADVGRVDGSRLDFDHVGVRAAQFSYSRLKGADPVAGVEMSSTGEVGCMGRGVRDAFMKAMLSTGFTVPAKRILLSTGPIADKVDFIDSAKKMMAMGYEIVASSGTARFLQNNGIPATVLAWPLEDKKPNIADAITNRDVDLIINIPKNNRETELRNDYIIRRMAVDNDIPLITNIKIAKQFTDALEWYKTRGMEIKSREEYR